MKALAEGERRTYRAFRDSIAGLVLLLEDLLETRSGGGARTSWKCEASSAAAMRPAQAEQRIVRRVRALLKMADGVPGTDVARGSARHPSLLRGSLPRRSSVSFEGRERC